MFRITSMEAMRRNRAGWQGGTAHAMDRSTESKSGISPSREGDGQILPSRKSWRTLRDVARLAVCKVETLMLYVMT